jgi:hypothetical protein
MEKNPQEAFPEFFKNIIMTKIIGLTGGIGSGKLRLQIIFNLWESRLYSGRQQKKTPEVIDYDAKRNIWTTLFGAVLKRQTS